MNIKPYMNTEVFDAAVLGAVQGLVTPERLHDYLRDLEREYLMLVDSEPANPTLGNQAHTIISKAGMLGLTRMSLCAAALENACRSGAGQAAALLQCRAATGDVRLYAMPAAETTAT